MIKSITTENAKRGDIRKMSAEVTIEGTRQELAHEFLGILESMEEQCPEILVMALARHMEGK
jgi:hypothetical protein